MVSGEHGAGQVVKGSVAHSTDVSLSIRLCFVASVFGNFGGMATGTFDAFGPTKLPNHFVTLGVVDQSLNVESPPAFLRDFCLTILCKPPDFGDSTTFRRNRQDQPGNGIEPIFCFKNIPGGLRPRLLRMNNPGTLRPRLV